MLISGVKETFLCSGGKFGSMEMYSNLEHRKCINELQDLVEEIPRHSVQSATRPANAYNKMIGQR